MDYSRIGNSGVLELTHDPFALTTGHFEPGRAEEFCCSVADKSKRALSLAELTYFKGNTDKALKLFSDICSDDSNRAIISSLFFVPVCSLFCGSSWDFIRTYNSVEVNVSKSAKGTPLEKIGYIFMTSMNILMHNNSEVRFPKANLDEIPMSQTLRPMAFYVYCRHLIETGDVGRAIGIAEATLIYTENSFPITEIYLNLIIARGYAVRCAWDKAEYYFRQAWSIAKPDALILPFAEHRAVLFGVLDKCLRYEEPELYKKILKLSSKYTKSWVRVHNELTGDNISDNLAPIEYNVAALAANGLLNTEIADFLGISVNSVRSHLRNVFNKLNIKSRKELGNYVI